MDNAELLLKIKTAPTEPGCYMFKDKYGYIIYVGKAKRLRNRVKQYFTKAAAEDERTAELVTKITDVEYHVVASELDALLHEYRLIKLYKPWYNVLMKADMQRPYLRIGNEVPYATLSICDTFEADGAAYFDFFVDEYDIKHVLDLLCRVWGLPQCGKRSFSRRQRPCVYHALGTCMAPCGAEPCVDRYVAAIDDVKRLFAGKRVKCITELKRDMREAADALAFERAAACRSMLEGLERLRQLSRRRYHLPDEEAVLILIRPYREEAFSAFYIIDKKVRNRTDFPAEPDTELIDSFIASLGNTSREYVPTHTAAQVEFGDWLADCLLEVGAEKHIVSLPPGKRARRIAEKAIMDFTKTSLKCTTSRT